MLSITKKQLINYYKAFNSVKKYQEKNEKAMGNAKFRYTIAINKDLIQNEIDILLDLEKTNEDKLKEFYQQRDEILFKYCIKDEDGKPVMEGNSVRFEKTNSSIIQKELLKLEEENKDLLEDYNSGQIEIESILEESVDIEFKTISCDIIPDEFEYIEEIKDIIIE